jgi:hypothetical protein
MTKGVPTVDKLSHLTWKKEAAGDRRKLLEKQ